jgi:hypothetical protein
MRFQGNDEVLRQPKDPLSLSQCVTLTRVHKIPVLIASLPTLPTILPHNPTQSHTLLLSLHFHHNLIPSSVHLPSLCIISKHLGRMAFASEIPIRTSNRQPDHLGENALEEDQSNEEQLTSDNGEEIPDDYEPIVNLVPDDDSLYDVYDGEPRNDNFNTFNTNINMTNTNDNSNQTNKPAQQCPVYHEEYSPARQLTEHDTVFLWRAEKFNVFDPTQQFICCTNCHSIC